MKMDLLTRRVYAMAIMAELGSLPDDRTPERGAGGVLAKPDRPRLEG